MLIVTTIPGKLHPFGVPSSVAQAPCVSELEPGENVDTLAKISAFYRQLRKGADWLPTDVNVMICRFPHGLHRWAHSVSVRPDCTASAMLIQLS
jgi:hypothetical protein